MLKWAKQGVGESEDNQGQTPRTVVVEDGGGARLGHPEAVEVAVPMI